MASLPLITNPEPMQPGLRSLIIYSAYPGEHLLFEVTDDGMSPHVNRGEFVIVDESDREPMHGELFLIQWSNGNRRVVEVGLFPKQDCVRPKGEQRGPWWNTYWTNTMENFDGSPWKSLRWFDGPYPEAHLAEKLVGRVVGIYQPDFRASLSTAAVSA